MTQFNPKLRYDSNPTNVWDSSEFNNELNSIDTAMASIPGVLLDTVTNQTINGQKTFFEFYTDSDNLETYESYMDVSPTDISPVFGAGNLAFELEGILQFGGYTRPNVSGFTFKLEPLNPSFMPGRFIVESTLASTQVYSSGNISLCEYDSTRDSTLPTLIGNAINVKNFLSSNTFSGIASINTNSAGTIVGDSWIHTILVLNVTDGNKQLLFADARSSIDLSPGVNIFRKVGIQKTVLGGPALEPCLQVNGNQYYPVNTLFTSTLLDPTKSIGVDCIIDTISNCNAFKYSLIYQQIGTALYENIPASAISVESAVTEKSNFMVSYARTKVPFIYEANGDLSLNPVIPSSTTYIKKLNHGDILL